MWNKLEDGILPDENKDIVVSIKTARFINGEKHNCNENRIATFVNDIGFVVDGINIDKINVFAWMYIPPITYCSGDARKKKEIELIRFMEENDFISCNIDGNFARLVLKKWSDK